MKRTTMMWSSSTEVGVAPQVLFDLLHDEGRFFDLRPGAVEHRDIQPLAEGGHSCTQVYEVNGRRIELRCRTTKFQPPVQFVDEVEAADHRATVTTRLEELESTTRLVVEQEVTLTEAVGVIRRRAIKADAERRGVAVLARIKSVAEGSIP